MLNIDKYSDKKYEEDLVESIKQYRGLIRTSHLLITVAAWLMVFPIVSFLLRWLMKKSNHMF